MSKNLQFAVMCKEFDRATEEFTTPYHVYTTDSLKEAILKCEEVRINATEHHDWIVCWIDIFDESGEYIDELRALAITSLIFLEDYLL